MVYPSRRRLYPLEYSSETRGIGKAGDYIIAVTDTIKPRIDHSLLTALLEA